MNKVPLRRTSIKQPGASRRVAWRKNVLPDQQNPLWVTSAGSYTPSFTAELSVKARRTWTEWKGAQTDFNHRAWARLTWNWRIFECGSQSIRKQLPILLQPVEFLLDKVDPCRL